MPIQDPPFSRRDGITEWHALLEFAAGIRCSPAFPPFDPPPAAVYRARMPHVFRSLPLCLLLAVLSAVLPGEVRTGHAAEPDPAHFNRRVLPLLAEHCFSCHGPDEGNRKADLRLDLHAGALTVLTPGDPAGSELLRRITSTDPADQMPPPGAQRTRLTAEQVDHLRSWIVDGAGWGKHWAFEPPHRPPVPPVASHPVDAFIRERLVRNGLAPAPAASLPTLARRSMQDLLGLPPSAEEVALLHNDTGPDAWSRWIDRLLASPRFGERMAMVWLDAARYADTDGYQADETRTNWPWRDWVVAAFNGNQPFDQFTIEQFAGDLLPGATDDQKLATAFHRHHMTNGEGGRDPEESRIDYVIDRVNTLGTVWLGLTLGCCQCHSHKFDPVSQAEYYSLTAFFNSIDEDGRAGRNAKPYLSYQPPRLSAPRAEAEALVARQTAREVAALAAAEAPFRTWLEDQLVRLKPGHRSWTPITDGELESTEGTRLAWEADGVIQASGPNPRQEDYRVIAHPPADRITGLRLEVFPHESHTQGSYSRGSGGHFILTDIKVQVRRRGDTQLRDLLVAGAVADHSDDPGKYSGYGNIAHVLDDDPRNGWSTRDAPATQPHAAVLALAEPLTLAADEDLVVELRQRSTVGDANLGRFRLLWTSDRGPATGTVGLTPFEQLTQQPQAQWARPAGPLLAGLRDQFLADFAPVIDARARLARARRQLDEVNAGARVDVQVLADRGELRPTQVLVRGQWDKKGETTLHGVPPAIAPWSSELPYTRLGLARWLTQPGHPLTARVFVNQVWQMLLGTGLVRTTEDFGLQGERPTHPELLDWLAVEFVESGWDVKRLVKLIVTSETYRQSSDISPEGLAADPENRWLARAPRHRLPSWMLRDAALHAAGLLSPLLGGPPVRPFQPEGIWEENFMGRFHYEPSDGPAQYRRSLYAFWRRAVAPTFLFDSAQRRVCEVRLPRTNTPLQALTLLNDASYLNAACALAILALRESANEADQLASICRRVLGRAPDPRESAILQRDFDRARTWYQAHPAEAEVALEHAGRNLEDSRPDLRLTPAEQGRRAEAAALFLIANLVLNLDEAVTHE